MQWRNSEYTTIAWEDSVRRAPVPHSLDSQSLQHKAHEGKYAGAKAHMLTLYCLSPSHNPHLLLTEDDHPSRFNWMPGGQVVPGAKALSILISLPEAISGCPGDADVVPAAVAQGQRQLGHLCRVWCKRYQRKGREFCCIVCVRQRGCGCELWRGTNKGGN